MIKQVLEYLTAPPVEELLDTENQEETPGLAFYLTEHLEQGEVQMPSVDAGLVLNPVYVKIPNEHHFQQTSVIDTRRVAYGLKIPARPLHKRPFYQRILFCLGGWIRSISRRSHEPLIYDEEYWLHQFSITREDLDQLARQLEKIGLPQGALL